MHFGTQRFMSERSWINTPLRLLDGVIRRVRVSFYRLRGMKIAAGCWLRSLDVPANHSEISLESGVAIDRHCTLLVCGEPSGNVRLRIAENVYINRGTMIAISESVQIGADCMIGPDCYITDHDHGIEQGKKIREQPLVSAPVRIEANVWLGAHVSILKGVSIGENAVVGAGSVVTRDVPAGAVVAGVPARVLRMRDLQGQNEAAE